MSVFSILRKKTKKKKKEGNCSIRCPMSTQSILIYQSIAYSCLVQQWYRHNTGASVVITTL